MDGLKFMHHSHIYKVSDLEGFGSIHHFHNSKVIVLDGLEFIQHSRNSIVIIHHHHISKIIVQYMDGIYSTPWTVTELLCSPQSFDKFSSTSSSCNNLTGPQIIHESQYTSHLFVIIWSLYLWRFSFFPVSIFFPKGTGIMQLFFHRAFQLYVTTISHITSCFSCSHTFNALLIKHPTIFFIIFAFYERSKSTVTPLLFFPCLYKFTIYIFFSFFLPFLF